MDRYIYNDPTTELSRQAQHDAHGDNPPLSPLILRGDTEGENPYFGGDTER